MKTHKDTTVYVILCRVGRGGGPRVGWPREEIGIEVEDKNQAGFELAREEAIEAWCEKHGLKSNQAYLFGAF